MKQKSSLYKILALVIISSLFYVSTATATTISNLNDLSQYIYSNMQSYSSPITVNYTNPQDITRQIGNNILTGVYLKDDYTAASYTGISLSFSRDTAVSSSINLNITPTYAETAANEAYVNQQVPIIVNSVIQAGMTDYQKIAALHDWVVTHVKYDTTLKNISDYDALVNGTTVCRGYSMLLYKLLTSAGLNSHIVIGKVSTGFKFRRSAEGHAWNMVQLNGNWYFIDSTNDGLSTDQTTKFFLVSSKTLKQNGFIWDESKFPSAANNYNSTQSSSGTGVVTLKRININGRLTYSLTPLTLSATGLYSDGSRLQLTGTQVVWTSSNPNVATIDSNGNVTFTGNSGEVSITAVSGGISTSVSTTVSYQLGMNRINYSTSSQTLSLYKVYNNGLIVQISSGITWSSLTPTVASIDSNGSITFSGTSGTAIINANYNGTTVSQQIQVRINSIFPENKNFYYGRGWGNRH